MKMTITGNNSLFDITQKVKQQLKAAGVCSAEFEARQLVQAFANKPKKLEQAVQRRIDGEPLQYLLGEWDFYGMTLKVDRRALIPRADTETLVDTALAFLKGKQSADIVDLCSGTGCIALSIAKNSGFSVTAVEKYKETFELLCENIKLCGLPVNAVCDDITQMQIPESYDLIVSNPPYIKAQDIPHLQREVGYEPAAALDGGDDGLDFYRIIAKKWSAALKSGGMLAVEIGIDQHNDVSSLFKAAGLTDIVFYKDLSGIIRVVSAKKQ